jgi:hypothetical protein
MDTNSGDIEMVPASNLNDAISTLNGNDSNMHTEFPQKIWDAAQTAENGATARFHEFLDFTPDSDTSLQEFNGQTLTEWPAATEDDGRGVPVKAPKPKSAKEMYNTMLNWINDNTLSDQQDTANRRWVRQQNFARLNQPYNIHLRGSHQGADDIAYNHVHNLYASSDNNRMAWTAADDNTQDTAKFELVNPSS